jgi:hypothetical protein
MGVMTDVEIRNEEGETETGCVSISPDFGVSDAMQVAAGRDEGR